jgi:hypothetical protein
VELPDRPQTGYFAKEDFQIDLQTMTCTCPDHQVSRTVLPNGSRTDRAGTVWKVRAFHFDPAICAVCPLRAQCVKAGPGTGRTVTIHPQERLLQEARALQASPAFAPYRVARQAAEHRLARLMHLGVRQARYFGREKTLYQLLMAATVANLTLVATKMGLMRARTRPKNPLCTHSLVRLFTLMVGFFHSMRITFHPNPSPLCGETGCRPGF